MELEKQVTIKNLTHDDLVNFLSGVGSFCSYWCSNWDVDDFDYKRIKQSMIESGLWEEEDICLEDIFAQALLQGVGMDFEEDETGASLHLTLEMVKEAIEKTISEGTVSSNLVEEWDAEDCDCIVQTALFGEVVYG